MTGIEQQISSCEESGEPDSYYLRHTLCLVFSKPFFISNDRYIAVCTILKKKKQWAEVVAQFV